MQDTGHSEALSGTLADTITEENISTMVYTFYARVRRHETLGPVFNDRLEGRWKMHQENMVDFWSNVLLRTGRYFGNPLVKHRKVSAIERGHFDEWLELFRETLEDIYTPETGEVIHLAARRMASGLTHGLFGPIRPDEIKATARPE